MFMSTFLLSAIIEGFAGAVADKAIVSAIEAVKDRHAQIRVFTEAGTAAASLLEHLDFVGRWASSISFRDLPQSKDLSASFVELECHVGQVAPEGASHDHEPRLASGLLNNDGNVVLLGRPGAGKTTTVQRLALTILERYTSAGAPAPIVLRARDLADKDSVVGWLALLAGIRVEQPAPSREERSSTLESEVRETQRRMVSAYLRSLRAVLFVDGLDECPPDLRFRAERDIASLMEHASGYRVVLTCRGADYAFSFPAQAYTLLPLKPTEVRRFATKWLGSAQAPRFLRQLEESPYYGAEVVPITLAHLCAIYERKGEIPSRPRYVYEKIVRLLLEEWDDQHGVRRESRYAGFGIEEKFEFLCRIAYELTTAGNRSSFDHSQLESAFLRCHELYGLPRTQCTRVAREIESHSGLILQGSYDGYEFAHKSIQEYLTAKYLVGLHQIPTTYFTFMGEELAIATALSTKSEDYLQAIAERLFGLAPGGRRQLFSRVFLARLSQERPKLLATDLLGWMLLSMWDLSIRNTPGAEPSHEVARAAVRIFRSLVSDETFRKAINYAMAEGIRIRESDDGWRIVPPAHLSMPKPIHDYVFGWQQPGLRMDDEIIQLLATA
jgi:hypothetical protein